MNKWRHKQLKARLKELRKAYQLAKDSKVGEEVICPSCGTKFIKNHHQSAFCKTKGGTKCKDFYWNNVVPEKRCNTTRISPANKAWQNKQESRLDLQREVDEEMHPHDPYALGQD